jgi:hypothetical protein
MCAKFLLAGMNVQQHEAGRRIVLGDNTGSMCSCYSQSGSSVLEFPFQLDFPVYICVYIYS